MASRDPSKGTGDIIGDPNLLGHTGNIRDSDVAASDASDTQPSCPQRGSQATSTHDNSEIDKDDGSMDSECPAEDVPDERPHPDPTLSQTEQQRADFVKGMTFVNDLMKNLGIATIAKAIRRSQQYEILKQHPRALRTHESTHVDGAWITGDIPDNMASLTYAERLRHLGVLGGSEIHKQALAFHRGESTDGQTSVQSAYASNLHINIPSVPGMVVLSPSHSPDAVFDGFRDPLMYNIRLPLPYMPLAVANRHLAEAHERWRQAEETGTKYKVPGSEVEIDVWEAKNARPSLLLGTNDSVRRAFDYLAKAIRSSQYSIDREIALEIPSLPLGSDADLLREGHPNERLQLQWGLVREIHRDGDLEEIEIEQLGNTEKEAKRASAFHPYRTHTFLVVFNPKTTYGYCLPASKLSNDYWTGEQFVYLPASEFAPFRFTTAEPDWLADLHQRIIEPNAQSERPEHIIPDNAVAEDYALTEEQEHETDEALTEDEFSSYPWWKIERWNTRAAHTGYGVYIPLGRDCKFANVVWMGYRWSVEETQQYFITRQLPVCFHQGDVRPQSPVLLIRVLLARPTNVGFSVTVSGSALEDAGFPCLYYVDCGSYRMKHIERSGLLFPSEYIDRELLQKQYAESIGKRVTQGPEGAPESGDASSAEKPAGYLARLERYLLAPCSGFHVREGEDFDDAVVGFYKAHLKDEKPLTWYGCEDAGLTAKLCYVVKARDIWQALADDWIPGGAIRVPASNTGELGDDDIDFDDDDGVSESLSDPGSDGEDE